MPEEFNEERALGRMEEQLSGLRRDQQQTRENIIRLFEAVESLRLVVQGSISPVLVHETRITSLERRMDGLWSKVIGLVTLVGGAVSLLYNLLKGH